MECNKEEALRAKEIAERKMQMKDYVAARKIILKAQQLFPDLENISQMLTVCDVHCSAELNRIGSDLDWYGILQLDQTANESSIRKQYRKFALLLHPDKNKFVGAEAAFKLIGEAQRVLCDQGKRSLYDNKRRPPFRTVAPRQPPHEANRTSYPRKHPVVPNTHQAAPPFTGLNQQQPQTQTNFSTAPTFWTKCPSCGIRYQYFKDIMNRSLRCQNCAKTFIAIDLNVQGVPAGENSGSTTWYRSAFPQHNGNVAPDGHRTGPQSTAGYASNMGFQRGAPGSEPLSKMGSGSGVGNKESVEEAKNRAKFEEGTKRAQAGNQSGNASRKRGRKVVTESSESCDTESTDTEDEVVEEIGLSTGQNPGMASSHRYPRRSSRQKQQVSYNYKDDVSDDDDTDFEIEPDSKKSRGNGSSGGVDNENSKACSKEDANITNRSANGTAVFEDKKEDRKEGCVPHEENLTNGNEQETNGKGQSGVEKKVGVSQPKSHSKLHPEILTYSEPEFYDFDQDRKECRFSPDQIWAVYDGAGGMPRYYVRIRNVSPGFKVQITWLEFIPNAKDQHEIDWDMEDLPTATGSFKHGKTETITDHGIFSHMIKFEKGKSRGSYKIYPVKGQIWALFKDWDIKWSSDPDIHRHYEFDYVEVISDYAEGLGIRVNYLVKVEGFKSLFRRMENKEMQIPSNELLRFSHMVPSHRVTGDERENIPGGSFELDPASLPSNNEESPLSENSNDVKAHYENVDAQSNGCSRSALEKKPTQSAMPETIRKNKESNEKSIGGKEDLTKKIGNPEKKTGVTDSTKSTAIEKDNILDDGDSSSNNASEHSDSSPANSPKAPPVYEYPDPEFYNFDADRSKDKFEPGQLWALYNDIDGMPTFYARIKKVELADFNVHITWLEFCPMIEEEIKWSEAELPIGCGTFKASSDSQIYDTTEMFSHQIRVQPTWKKNRYEIYPRKGEVWAVCKNWSIDLTRDDLENCEHEMGEVFSESSVEMIVLVLKKVDGYKTVFEVQRRGGEAVTMSIPRNEWLRFAHKIPAFRLTEEKGGKLRGCLELDPASTPAILFCTSSD